MLINDQTTAEQQRSIRVTLIGVALFILVIVAGFIYRIQQPRVMTVEEMRANGLYLLNTPRDIGKFDLIDHRGEPFGPARFAGRWSLVFFGFTHCPDVCPTAMASLAQFVRGLDEDERGDTSVVLVTVDPARDTTEKLAAYVPYFNPDFTGVTGDFLEINRLATALNTPFRKVPGQGEDYLVDHSANVVLINPRGDYHGFFKTPLDLAKMQATYRSARALWEG
jgi:protein SCO1/2